MLLMCWESSKILSCTARSSFGVTLGAGCRDDHAGLAYIISMRDSVVDDKEAQYARAITRATRHGFCAWLPDYYLRALAYHFLHFMAGEGSTTVFLPRRIFLNHCLLFLRLILFTAATYAHIAGEFPRRGSFWAARGTRFFWCIF